MFASGLPQIHAAHKVPGYKDMKGRRENVCLPIMEYIKITKVHQEEKLSVYIDFSYPIFKYLKFV